MKYTNAYELSNLKATSNLSKPIEVYRDLIASVDADIITFDDYILQPIRAGRRLIIRHDVDLDINRALAFARYENKLGIVSTYFLLNTAMYFDYSQKFLNICKEIQDLGHSIGFHNDLLTECFIQNNDWYYCRSCHTYSEENSDTSFFCPKCFSTNVVNVAKSQQITSSIENYLHYILDFLRSGGIDIHGTSSHGSVFCYHNNVSYYNYEIWQEFDKNLHEGRLLSTAPCKLSLADFGLDYEAYFLPTVGYFSDSGSAFQGIIYVESDRRLFERTLSTHINNTGYKAITVFNAMTTASAQLLIHPIRYEI